MYGDVPVKLKLLANQDAINRKIPLLHSVEKEPQRVFDVSHQSWVLVGGGRAGPGC